MTRNVLISKGVLTGLLFTGAGAAFVVAARGYSQGPGLGPDTFPTYVGSALILVGVLVMLQAVLRGSPRVEITTLRPLAAILAGLIAFSFVVHTLGLVAGVLLIVGASRLANPELRWGEAALVFVALTIFVAAVFVYGRGVPIPIFGGK